MALNAYSSDCTVCKNEAKENAIECSFCLAWFHIKCVDVAKSVSKSISGLDSIHWYCCTCQSIVKDLFNNSRKKVNIPVVSCSKTDSMSLNSSSSKEHSRTEIPKVGGDWNVIKPKKVNNSKKQPNLKVSEKLNNGILETKNKFKVLGHDLTESTTCEYTVLGDSIIRDQDSHFCNRGKRSRRAHYIPGAKIKKITSMLDEISENKGSLIIHVGTNDMVQPKQNNQPPKANRASETVFNDYRELITALKVRKQKSVLVGILPRLNVNDEISSRIIAMNNRVSKYCTKEGIGFIDLYDTFCNRPKFYIRDGLHLSQLGKQVYAKTLDRFMIEKLGF